MTRRTLLPTLVGAASLPALRAQSLQLKGRLKQGVTRGVFGRGKSLEECCAICQKFGIKGFDLIGPNDFPLLKKYGMIPTMTPGGGSIRDGINRKEFHDRIEKAMREAIDATAAAGGPNVIVLSGERKGMSDAEGADNSVAFFNRIKGYAEQKKITLCLELLNSKVNHPDYMCDHTKWGVDVCKRVNSPRVKLLYDIYHMQIMEGDIIRTVKDSIKWIGHFHTAGNPGRHEFDETQELSYPGICKAIVETGYDGWLSHEYSPLKDPVKSLEDSLKTCDV